MTIAVVLRHDLEPWQRLNVTAFTVSGVGSRKDAVGEKYQDGSGLTYLPMFKDPVLVFGADAAGLARTADRARSRNVAFSVFTEDLFGTFNDIDNRAAVAAHCRPRHCRHRLSRRSQIGRQNPQGTEVVDVSDVGAWPARPPSL